MASEDHIALLRGRRLYELRRYSDAAKFLEEARKGENLQVRAEATFYLAMMKSSYKEAHREEKLALVVGGCRFGPRSRSGPERPVFHGARSESERRKVLVFKGF